MRWSNFKFFINVIGNSNDEYDFPHKSSLNNTQISRLCKAFANNSSANMKLSKIQLHKIRQSRGWFSRRLGSLLQIGLPLIKSILKPLAKTVLILLGLTTAASATYAAIPRKIFWVWVQQH